MEGSFGVFGFCSECCHCARDDTSRSAWLKTLHGAYANAYSEVTELDIGKGDSRFGGKTHGGEFWGYSGLDDHTRKQPKTSLRHCVGLYAFAPRRLCSRRAAFSAARTCSCHLGRNDGISSKTRIPPKLPSISFTAITCCWDGSLRSQHLIPCRKCE